MHIYAYIYIYICRYMQISYLPDELYSGIANGIANGRVLTVELCTHRNQKLIFLDL